MGSFLILIHLHAKGAPRKGMFRVTGNFDRVAVYDFCQKPAGVRAIIRANRPFHLFQHGKFPSLSPGIKRKHGISMDETSLPSSQEVYSTFKTTSIPLQKTTSHILTYTFFSI